MDFDVLRLSGNPQDGLNSLVLAAGSQEGGSRVTVRRSPSPANGSNMWLDAQFKNTSFPFSLLHS